MKFRITKISVILFIYLAVFVLHFTIAQVFLPSLTNLYYVCIFLFSAFLLSKNKVETVSFPLILAAILSIILSNSVNVETYMRFFSWILVILVAGPFLQNRVINIVRDKMFWWLIYIFIFITIGSFFWVIAKRPSLGVNRLPIAYGTYYLRNGISLHEMLLAPMAGISALYSWHNLFFMRISKKIRTLNIFIFFISIAVMLMASSRIVLVSIFATMLFSFSIRFPVFLRKIRANTGWVTLAVIVILFSLVPAGIYLSKFIKNNTRIEDKGTNNSRVEMWAARFADFELNPLSGAGFASVSKEVSDQDNLRSGVTKTGQIEFGSLYGQVLSTMGIAGILALIYFYVKIFYVGYVNRSKPMSHLPLLIFVFLLMQNIAETHILSSGSVLCVFSWLVFTRLYNLQYIRKINFRPVVTNQRPENNPLLKQQRLQGS